MHQVFDEEGKSAGLSGQSEIEEDLFEGEILSKMADKEERPHECRFRRRKSIQGASADVSNGNGIP